MKVEILLEAQDELSDARDWYERQKAGLGEEFLVEVGRALQRMEAFPNAWPKLSRRSRRCRLNRFPYGIIYQYRKDSSQILIIAIAHLHRYPNYWHSRE